MRFQVPVQDSPVNWILVPLHLTISGHGRTWPSAPRNHSRSEVTRRWSVASRRTIVVVNLGRRLRGVGKTRRSLEKCEDGVRPLRPAEEWRSYIEPWRCPLSIDEYKASCSLSYCIKWNSEKICFHIFYTIRAIHASNKIYSSQDSDVTSLSKLFFGWQNVSSERLVNSKIYWSQEWFPVN